MTQNYTREGSSSFSAHTDNNPQRKLPSWLFSLKDSFEPIDDDPDAPKKSLRFVDFSFNGNGFNKGKGLIAGLLASANGFLSFIVRYIILKAKQVVMLAKKTVAFAKSAVLYIKRWSVRKLIWSRGKLGRPIANLAVMSVAFIVFTFGEVLNSNKFVNSQELNPDYLSNVSDIIPSKNITTTQIPEERKRAESFAYTVQGGDTLSGIGSKFKISIDALKYVNGLTDNSVLRPGQEVTIPPVSGLIHEVEDGDSLASIAEKYSVPEQAIADFNYILDTSTLAVGTELVVPDAKVPEPEIVPIIPTVYTQPVQYGAPTPSGNFCVWPSTTTIITQYFSWYHNGLDVATPWGSLPPLFACTDGTVTRAGWDPWGLGLHVRIDHGGGYETVYGHMSRIDVGYGANVGRGQQIGVMGSTGRSTGPHVHFIVNYYGVAQNPLNYVN